MTKKITKKTKQEKTMTKKITKKTKQEKTMTKKITKKTKQEKTMTKKITKKTKQEKTMTKKIKPYGIKYKFFKKNNATLFLLSFGQDMQKQLKLKKGSKLIVEHDKKDPYKLVIKKAKSKKEATHSLVQNTNTNNIHFTPTWKFKKLPARLLKQARKNAIVKIRKNDIVVEMK